MKKTDVLHISRNIKQNNDNILIHGFSIFYVNAMKEIMGTTKKFCELRDMDHGKSGSDAYWDLAEENRFLEIAKKSVSGSLNQNLNIYDVKDNDILKDLQKIIDTRLNGAVSESFAKYIADNFTYVGCYAIQIMACELTEASKDSKGYKTTDDDLCDADTVVHKFMIVSICPMEEVTIGLYFNKQREIFSKWEGHEEEVSLPITAFLYPCCEDGYVNDKQILIYNKNRNNPVKALLNDVFKENVKKTPKEQRATFVHIIENALNESEITDIKPEVEQITDRIVSNLSNNEKDISEKTVDISTLTSVLDEASVPARKIEQAVKELESQQDSIYVSNIVTRKKARQIQITVPEEQEIEKLKKTIDGIEYLMIPINKYQIKGI